MLPGVWPWWKMPQSWQFETKGGGRNSKYLKESDYKRYVSLETEKNCLTIFISFLNSIITSPNSTITQLDSDRA